MRRNVQTLWFHHGGIINGAVRYVCTKQRSGCSPGEECSRRFLSRYEVECGKEAGRETELRGAEGNWDGARVHFPCTHTPYDHSSSISGRDVECNSPTVGERDEEKMVGR